MPSLASLPLSLHDALPISMPVSQFVSTFSPEAGKHTVALVHPATGEAVTVQFTLPEGCRKVNFDGNKKVVFDCGDKEVAIRFLDRKSTRLNSSHLGISYAVPRVPAAFPTRRSSDLDARVAVREHVLP